MVFHGHPRRLLFLDIQPLTTFMGFSLKSSILVISVIDFFCGILDLYRFVQISLLMYLGSANFLSLLNLASLFIGSLSIVFSFNSIKSILILKWKYMYEYSLYKQVEFILQMLIAVIFEITQFQAGIVSYPTLIYIFFTRLALFYLAWVIWSAYYHIQKGDTFIVLEGTLLD